MEQIAFFSLTPTRESHSLLSVTGLGPRASVPGVVLEAQYRLADGSFLVISTDDCPYEECLHLLRLSRDYTIQERVDLGRSYTFGLFSDPKIIHPSCLEFTFYENTRFQAIILDKPQRALGKLLTHWDITYTAPFAKKSLQLVRVR